MNTDQTDGYDRVPYPGDPFPATHPDRMATIGAIFGLRPASIEHCRVLEIGCADGGNIVPMASSLPGSQFTGIDLSARAVAAALETISALGLQNISVHQRDVLDLCDDGSRYDYIIAHGVYSWVPQEVRTKILSLCSQLLSDHGIAYISYNTHPGGHFRDLVRDLMRYHVRNEGTPDKQRDRGIALLRSVASAQDSNDLYAKVLQAEVERITEHELAGFYHDDLAECRSAFYFHEFIDAAAGHGLQFLSEACVPEMRDSRFPPEVIDAIAPKGADRITRQQYLDFLKARRFRQTLLCRRERVLTAENPSVVRQFYISSDARAHSDHPKLDDSTPEQFTTAGGAAINTSDDLAKAIMVHLVTTSPLPCAFEALLDAADGIRDSPSRHGISDEVKDEYAAALLSMYSAGLVDFSTRRPSFTMEISELPRAYEIARQQLASGAVAVTNCHHTKVSVPDPIARELIRLLDGKKNRDELADRLVEFCHRQEIRFRGNHGTELSSSQLRTVIASGLDANLRKIARIAILVA